MDHQSLEAFLAVADSGSFSRAAERLFLTQPAISKRVANLESSLDTKLFDRIGREVYLTEAGRLLVERAGRILEDIRDARQAITQSASGQVGHIAVASSHHIGLHYLGPILRTLVERHPQAQLDLRFLESEQTLQAILKRDLELAFITLPSTLPRDLIEERLWTDQLHFVATHDHPLAAKKGAIRLNELVHFRAILPEENTTTFRLIQSVFDRHHLPLKRRLAVNYLETIGALVSSGLGWSLLPDRLINDSMTILDVEQVRLERHLGVIRHRRRTPSQGALELLAIAREVATGVKAQDV
ncbi:LysR family transcriptional regulator [Saccharospirillum mangrovi]|uniref:LysR family transcriptional regulator n=1 Tax=Saccharospirillum mangrovi TaxID=2161747 RepID=UPI000D3D6BD9|nr:LysR family transcriptional regulator [Saccharospirillum mangrovi]